MPFQLEQRDFQSGAPPDAGANAVRFQQQGQVDWTNLGSSSISASIHILSRISAAGIDPFTIVMGQAIGGSLLWRDEGRERFDKALQSCQGLAGYRNVLWFGFGVKHIAHVLTATDQGSTCAALCACLAECYSVTYAAEIMLEMTKASKPTTETTPSLVSGETLSIRVLDSLQTRPSGFAPSNSCGWTARAELQAGVPDVIKVGEVEVSLTKHKLRKRFWDLQSCEEVSFTR